MPLFGKKLVTCPMCDEGLPVRENKLMHYASHAVQVQSGQYGWKCGCGEEDGLWESDIGAAAGIAEHFARRHGISQSVTLGI